VIMEISFKRRHYTHKTCKIKKCSFHRQEWR
jgi:hypothetical protein